METDAKLLPEFLALINRLSFLTTEALATYWCATEGDPEVDFGDAIRPFLRRALGEPAKECV